MSTFKVEDWSQGPQLSELDPLPSPSDLEVQLDLVATALHPVVRSRASGQHYSARQLPHTVGVDGVGRTKDGDLVYFTTFSQSGGSFATQLTVPKANITPIPTALLHESREHAIDLVAENDLSDTNAAVKVAAGVNPAMASYMAIRTRTTALPKGFTALILGATSAAGRAAIHIARHLGAGKVFGLARNQGALDTLGLDRSIVLKDPAAETEFGDLRRVDLVLDFLYGEPVRAVFAALPPFRPIQYVQIGSLAGQSIDLPSALLRGKDVTLRGAGPGAWRFDQLQAELPGLLEAMVGLKGPETRTVRFEMVEEEWGKKEGRERLVFVGNGGK
ncbi:hypothetical protein M501DRAFT_1012476 [Patellaria atrata CBS 101060]|uniref:Enoyl reductase (ER) domain-containing protein n=1 Tax=Patellaria atrata CBS 101060 TaxID=1346257 RepID=A0A9P4SIW7_9PEZI|nr:hypothetical protein M501DRAFT_1012476 [Patellaria atrata CBS 101060]